MACTSCNQTTNTCGCNQTNSVCFTYQGVDLDCIGVPCGLSLDAVLAAINQKICEITEAIVSIGGGGVYTQTLVGDDLQLLRDGVVSSQVDLSKYLDNINLQGLSLDNTTGILTATLTNGAIIPVDLSGVFTDTTNASLVVTNTGTDTKIITLTDSNGGTVQGSFTDNSASEGIQSVVAGTNVTVDTTDPDNPIVSSVNTDTIANGSETIVNAGTNVTVTGTGTTATPYVINSIGGATNLGYTASPTEGTVTSDSGTDATIPLATTGTIGLIDNEVISFTPSISIPGLNYDSTGTSNATSVFGSYVKVGNMLYIRMFFNWADIGLMTGSHTTGDIVIDNIPLALDIIMFSEILSSTNPKITFNNSAAEVLPFESLKIRSSSSGSSSFLIIGNSSLDFNTNTERPLFQYSNGGTRGIRITMGAVYNG